MDWSWLWAPSATARNFTPGITPGMFPPGGGVAYPGGGGLGVPPPPDVIQQYGQQRLADFLRFHKDQSSLGGGQPTYQPAPAGGVEAAPSALVYDDVKPPVYTNAPRPAAPYDPLSSIRVPNQQPVAEPNGAAPPIGGDAAPASPGASENAPGLQNLMKALGGLVAPETPPAPYVASPATPRVGDPVTLAIQALLAAGRAPGAVPGLGGVLGG